MQPLLLPLPCLVCSRGVLPVMPQEEEFYLLLLLPSLHVFPAFVVLCGNLFSSTASSPASLVFHLPDASLQLPSFLLPYRIYHRGELYFLATRRHKTQNLPAVASTIPSCCSYTCYATLYISVVILPVIFTQKYNIFLVYCPPLV